jgi:hypothetical protein
VGEAHAGNPSEIDPNEVLTEQGATQMSKSKPKIDPTPLGCLTIAPPTRGHIKFEWHIFWGDQPLGPPRSVVELMRASLAEFIHTDHGCKDFVFVSWWKGWLTVAAEHAPAAQALLQHWLRLCCTWPGAGMDWRNRERHVAELAPPPPEQEIPPSRVLEMAEQLRRLDDVLFFSAVELEDPRFTRAMAEIESNWPEPDHDLARFLPPRPALR